LSWNQFHSLTLAWRELEDEKKTEIPQTEKCIPHDELLDAEDQANQKNG